MSSTRYQQWFANLPIPWLFGGTNGQKLAGALGLAFDSQVDRLKDATKAHIPATAPNDALALLGSDAGLVQGLSESTDNFRTRIKTRYDDWSRAGTALELLVQLYWAGYVGAVIAQQNGLLYSLSGAPVAGQDPTPLLVIQNAAALPTPLTSATRPDKTIPAGTPWFAFDDDTSHTSRFAIIMPSPPASASAYTTAVFDGSTDTVTASWSSTLPSVTYYTMSGLLVTDSSGPIVISISAKTQTTITIKASAPFTGSVYMLGYSLASAPFAITAVADIGAITKIITTWKPARAICMGIYTITSGRMWDYPLRTWDQGGNWDPDTETTIAIGV